MRTHTFENGDPEMASEDREERERFERKIREEREKKEYGQVEPNKAIVPQSQPGPTPDDDDE